jgi:hypothetical protein
MQVVACKVSQAGDVIKIHFERRRHTDEPDAPHPLHARRSRAAAMMAPIIILGAILVFLAWDTSDHK